MWIPRNSDRSISETRLGSDTSDSKFFRKNALGRFLKLRKGNTMKPSGENFLTAEVFKISMTVGILSPNVFAEGA